MGASIFYLGHCYTSQGAGITVLGPAASLFAREIPLLHQAGSSWQPSADGFVGYNLIGLLLLVCN